MDRLIEGAMVVLIPDRKTFLSDAERLCVTQDKSDLPYILCLKLLQISKKTNRNSLAHCLE